MGVSYDFVKRRKWFLKKGNVEEGTGYVHTAGGVR